MRKYNILEERIKYYPIGKRAEMDEKQMNPFAHPCGKNVKMDVHVDILITMYDPKGGEQTCIKFLEFYILYKKFLLFIRDRRYVYANSLLQETPIELYKRCMGYRNKIDVSLLHFIAYDNFNKYEKIYVTFLVGSKSSSVPKIELYDNIFTTCGYKGISRIMLIHMGGHFLTGDNTERIIERTRTLNRIRETKKKYTFFDKSLDGYLEQKTYKTGILFEVLYIWDIEKLYITRNYQHHNRNNRQVTPHRLTKFNRNPKVPRLDRGGILARIHGVKTDNMYISVTQASETGGRSRVFRRIRRD